MASPSELTLDYNPNANSNPNAYPFIQQTQKLEDFLARLEEERLKIEAFKRELPLCMQLLNNAMETYKRQLETFKNNNDQGVRPVLEEFIPLTNMNTNGSEKSNTTPSEKANWMVSAQLWSPASNLTDMSAKLALDTKQRNGGAFLPFSKEKMSKGSGTGSRVSPELALASTEKELEDEKKCSEIVSSNGVMGKSSGHEEGKGSGSNGNNEGQVPAGQSSQRKARRCWSPDLHRRFVSALQMLGGSQVATPKQIRELMKVDGLTNDEVKSHLQKYRLHTRRPLQPPHPPSTAPPQLVVLGGIWVPPEYATSAAGAGGPTIYGAHPVPTAHYPVPHDFYASSAAHHQVHHLPRGPYKARVVHSPESELRSSGDHSESMEDGEVEEEEEQEEEMEEGKADDKALVPVVDSNGNGSGSSDVALKI